MINLHQHLQQRPWALLPIIWLAALGFSLPLLQRVPNGADHYFMIDVGETQIVLNNWGTLHMTGYPHYTILGNLLTDGMMLFGMRPLVAAAVVSLVWGLVSLALIYWLLLHITARPLLSAALTVIYSLTLTVWIHFVIAEIYTFGLALLVGLLLLALWRGAVPGWDGSLYARIYWLALLGGIGVAHHRAIAMVAPALIFAVWGELTRDWRRLPTVVLKSLLLGLLGFVPYAYLMIRARMGADWVYGDPETLSGLWWQFTGQEVAYFIGPPETFADFLSNLNIVNQVLITDLTLPGIVLGLLGLFAGIVTHKQASITMLISGAVAYAFHATFYTDILSALILPITLSLVFGWLLLADLWLQRSVGGQRVALVRGATVVLVLAATGWFLVRQNTPFIRGLVTDTAGLEAITMAEATPQDATLMIPWGPLHFAVGYAQDIEGELQHFTLMDHTADYSRAFRSGELTVPEYIQHNAEYNLNWWRTQLGNDIIPQTVAPRTVGFLDSPTIITTIPDTIEATAQIACNDDTVSLQTEWTAPQDPLRDMTVFAHLLDGDGTLIAQDDHPPAYGWHPTSVWQPGEVVHEIHFLPRLPAAATIRYGLYYQNENSEFINEYEREIPVECNS